MISTQKIKKGQLSGVVESVVAGTNITIDNTDPLNPIINASGGGGSGNDIVITKLFANTIAIYTAGNWYGLLFVNTNSFFSCNFNNGVAYGTGASPAGTPSIVVPSLNYIAGKKLDKFTWNTDYCDQFDGNISLVKYDLIAGALVNGREILNQQMRILSSGVNTQSAVPFSKNKLIFTTTDVVDTPISAQCSVYFMFLKRTTSTGDGLGFSYVYFNFN